ncbi:MAG: undecaprenyl-diphosphate phosphatase, partial [Clostridia bacterium]|nr:undecaprenyl-diphosphate phosphatase [Clostridia bacterium]
GLMQCIGTFAGVSRSGSTITGGLATGLNRKKVADFSFMMSIPAILGAVLLDILDLESASLEAMSASVGPVLAGIAAAMISGFLAIKFMLYMIRKIRLRWFAASVGVLGAVILIMDIVK